MQENKYIFSTFFKILYISEKNKKENLTLKGSNVYRKMSINIIRPRRGRIGTAVKSFLYTFNHFGII